MDFSRRSYQTELLDRDDIPFDDIKRNMEELNVVNTFLGGHKTTIRGLSILTKGQLQHNTELTICEIGCGGGDNLRLISRWCEKNNIPAVLIGIDKNSYCIDITDKRLRTGLPRGISYRLLITDYIKAGFTKKPDIVFSSLFCHHFTDDELQKMICWMRSNSEIGFFINDLHRHPIAFYSIKWLTTLFSKSYLVKHDAPLSVLRGFRKKEWLKLFYNATLPVSISWHWAFRWLVIFTNKKKHSNA